MKKLHSRKFNYGCFMFIIILFISNLQAMDGDQACNLHIWEVEVGEVRGQSHPKLYKRSRPPIAL